MSIIKMVIISILLVICAACDDYTVELYEENEMKQVPFQQDNVTQLPADDFNQIPREEENLIFSADIPFAASPSGLGADNSQVAKAVATYSGDGDFYIDGGSANVYQLLPHDSREEPPVYTTGQRVRFIPDNANSSTSCTVQIATFAVIPVGAYQGVVPNLAAVSVPVGTFTPGEQIELIYSMTTDGNPYFRVADVSLSAISKGDMAVVGSSMSFLHSSITDSVYIDGEQVRNTDSSAGHRATMINGTVITAQTSGGTPQSVTQHPKGVSFSNSATDISGVNYYRLGKKSISSVTFSQSGDFPWAYFATSLSVLTGIPWSASNRLLGATITLRDDTTPATPKYRTSPASISIVESGSNTMEIEAIYVMSVLSPSDANMAVQELVLAFSGNDLY